MKGTCQIRLEANTYTLTLKFCHADVVGPSGRILTVEHIHILCIYVLAYGTISTEPPPESAFHDPSIGIQQVVAYPWEDMVGVWAEQEGFMRLQMTFESHDGLVQFMQVQRAALSKLNGRIGLFYYYHSEPHFLKLIAADFENLDELPGGMLVFFVLPRYHSSTEYY